ncbi:MAG: LysM peptidoglycan-binding domain-containing protein [Anaerolineae bacterium]
MTLNKTPNQPPRGKPTEPWRVERMVQRVPGHLDEESRFSPWLIVALVAIVVIIGIILLLLTQTPGTTPAASGPQATAAAPTRRVTIIRITATPQPTLTPTIAPTPVYVKYTVKKGDTLSTIARQFKVSVEAIRSANNLTDDTLHPGDVLNIPQGAPTPGAVADSTGAPDTPGTAGPPTNMPVVFRTPTLIPQATDFALATTPTATPGVVVYTVRSGDTLGAIASYYSTTVQSIMDLSKITSINLKVGQVLTIPIGIWTPTTAPPTVYNSPTPTLTPEFSYAAPDLLSPADGSDFAHDGKVTLQWLSLGIKSDEYYVVHVRYIANGIEVTMPVYTVRYDEGTSVTLNTSPAGAGGPAQFWWYVVVVRESGCGTEGTPISQPCAVSPLSEARTLTWR